MLVRAWRRRWSKVRLLAPLWRPYPGLIIAPTLQYPELSKHPRPALHPYEGLAEFWHEHARGRVPNYAAFLTGLAKVYNLKVRSILDLACGTGTLTARLAAIAPDLVGLDASEPMLARARARHGSRPGVEFVTGDFRHLHLGRRFDAVVCASNSLNYVSGVDELSQVFRGVSASLNPSGLFVFDTTTTFGALALAGWYYHFEVGGIRFAIHFRQGPGPQPSASVVHLPAGTEEHWRVAIDPEDVIAAARGSGLAVHDYFCTAVFPGRWVTGHAMFFVLSKTA